MKILSIDVGIKNLACCLFNLEENKYTIDSWDIIDLCETIKEKCLCINKNNTICNKNAIYYKNNLYYCKKHAETDKYLIPTKDLTIGKIKKKKIDQLKELCDKYNIPIISPGLKKNMIESVEKYVSERCLDKIVGVNANNVDLISIGRKINELLSNKYKDRIDIVLIENQISPIANRMKTIQGMLSQYFIMKNVEKIEFVSSINKLKEFDFGKLSYNERKKKGIEITSGLITENNLKTFNKSKKKDDLADCFLQGLWYLKTNKLII
jgi:hypothetical protein